jgi:hypothetical protein
VPGSGAVYNELTGIFTCLDGTRVDIGPNFGDCSVLNLLLHPVPLCDHVLANASACLF